MVSTFTELARGNPNFILLPTSLESRTISDRRGDPQAESLEQLRLDIALHLTDPDHGEKKKAERARDEWLDRVEGGPGCWVSPDKKIPGL